MSKNSIALASELGQECGGFFPQLVFEEMQIAFLLKAARHPHFTSNFTKGRLRENLMFVAPPGWGKSFSTDVFLKECLGAIPYSQSSEFGPPKFRYVQLDGGAVTVESMRGGCNEEGRPIIPLAICGDAYYVTDLVTFLGTGENRNKALNMMLLLGEDGKQDVFLTKMENLDEGEAETFKEAVSIYPEISYIAKPRKGFTINVHNPFIVCTTDKELRGGKNALEENAPGVLSRFTIIEWTPTDHEVEQVYIRDIEDIDYSQLRSMNQAIWRRRVDSIPFPPRHLYNPIKEWLLSEVRDIATDSETTLAKTLDRRLLMRVARLMAASALARHHEAKETDDVSPIKALTYIEADADFARQRLSENNLASIAERVSSDAKEAVRNDKAIEAYLKFLRSLNEPWPDRVSRNKFKAFCMNEAKGPGLSSGTVANYLTKLKKASITQSRHAADMMVNDESWLRRNRFIKPPVEMPSAADVGVDLSETPDWNMEELQ